MRPPCRSLAALGALALLLLGFTWPDPCPLPADAPGRLLQIIPEASTVRFDADAGLHDFSGEAQGVTGWILLPERGPEEVLACVTVRAEFLKTGIDLRDRLMREDHLEHMRHPHIRLTVRGARVLERSGAERLRAEVQGVFALHGISRERTLPVEVMLDGEGLTVAGSFPVHLSDHAIARPAFLFVRMRYLVEVTVRLVAGSKEAGP